MLSALLGGLYSSTLSTVVLAKRARAESRAASFCRSDGAGLRNDVRAVAGAAGAVQSRVVAPVADSVLWRWPLPERLGGWLWSRRREPDGEQRDDWRERAAGKSSGNQRGDFVRRCFLWPCWRSRITP